MKTCILVAVALALAIPGFAMIPDPAENLTLNSWASVNSPGGNPRGTVSLNADPAYVKEGSASIHWQIQTTLDPTDYAEYELYSPTLGQSSPGVNGDLSNAWYVQFWMYVTSPTGANKYGFTSNWLNPAVGWLDTTYVAGGNGDGWITSADPFPMNQWNQIRLRVGQKSPPEGRPAEQWNNVSAVRLLHGYEGVTGWALDGPHTFDVYVDDIQLVVPEPSSLLALGSFGIGLLGFKLRRR